MKKSILKEVNADDAAKIIDSNVVIKGINICLKSVFYNKIPLEKALGNIAFRKMRKLDKNSKF